FYGLKRVDHRAVIATAEVFTDKRQRKLCVTLAEVHRDLTRDDKLAFLEFSLKRFELDFKVLRHRRLNEIDADVGLDFLDDVFHHLIGQLELNFFIQQCCMENE